MRKILVLFAHPLVHKSRVNIQLIKAVEGLDNVTVNHLYENYPDFYIDVKREQELLLEHDVIIWHHPFYWYSAPAMIKEWFDLVLEHGFAYGSEGNALKGKYAMTTISTGGRESTYQSNGLNQYPINDFLIPFRQSANLCRMTYLPPFVIYGSHLLDDSAIHEKSKQYRRVVEFLRDGNYHEGNTDQLVSMNQWIS